MELSRPKAILFDWDNTLVNTWPVIHAALHKTFAELGHEPWSMEQVKKRVSRSMRDSFPEIFGENWQPAGELYQQNFRAIHLERLDPLKDAEAVLAFLTTQPVYVAAVSNKRGDNLRREIGHLGWEKYFRKIVGAGDTSHDKPHPAPVIEALRGSNIAAGRDVWFVGDSEVDMQVAHATGCVPVWYGELPEDLAFAFHARFADHASFLSKLKTVFT